MAADMCFSALALRRGTTLDWDAAETAIYDLGERAKDRIAEALGLDVCDVAERLRAAVTMTQLALLGGNRELTSLEFGPWIIFITGGLSTGDTPTDLFDGFWALEVSGLDRVIGFDWPPTPGRIPRLPLLLSSDR